MQVQGRDTTVSNYVRYSGPLDCALTTMKNEGVSLLLSFFPPTIWLDCWFNLWPHITFPQITGIFRGGFSTLVRESIGTATFFSIYELIRHYMHLQLNSKSPEHSRLPKLLSDLGVGIISGGVAGTTVSLLNHHFSQCKTYDRFFSHCSSLAVLGNCFAIWCRKNHNTDCTRPKFYS